MKTSTTNKISLIYVKLIWNDFILNLGTLFVFYSISYDNIITLIRYYSMLPTKKPYVCSGSDPMGGQRGHGNL